MAENDKRSNNVFCTKSVLLGLFLILFLVFAEAVPVSETLRDVPRFFTVHLLIDLLPSSMLDLSSKYLFIPASLFFFLAFMPVRKYKIHAKSLILICSGFIFFPSAFLIPNAVSMGPLWGILAFLWLGANMLFRNLDYFYSSALGILLWDMGAGIQGLLYDIPLLPEPYWNAVPPLIVVVIDAVAIVAVLLCWRFRFSFGKMVPVAEVAQR